MDCLKMHKKRPSTLDEQMRQAQAKMAKWPKEKRDMIMHDLANLEYRAKLETPKYK